MPFTPKKEGDTPTAPQPAKDDQKKDAEADAKLSAEQQAALEALRQQSAGGPKPDSKSDSTRVKEWGDKKMHAGDKLQQTQYTEVNICQDMAKLGFFLQGGSAKLIGMLGEKLNERQAKKDADNTIESEATAKDDAENEATPDDPKADDPKADDPKADGGDPDPGPSVTTYDPVPDELRTPEITYSTLPPDLAAQLDDELDAGAHEPDIVALDSGTNGDLSASVQHYEAAPSLDVTPTPAASDDLTDEADLGVDNANAPTMTPGGT